MSVRQPRLSGLIPHNHPWHYVLDEGDPLPTERSRGRRLAPRYTRVPGFGKIPVWGPAKRDKVDGFRPAMDCDGNFMSYRFQVNNNCYNYACNIATNSFAQPGRRHGIKLLKKGKMLKASDVIVGAEADGLKLIGREEMSLSRALNSAIYLNGSIGKGGGHLVALFLSEAQSDIRWRGDYHWVRSDHPSGRKWSQKDGPDHVTNFDFRGNWIVDPTKAFWTVNMGPPQTGWGRRKDRLTSKIVTYCFAAWMFVPYGRVSII
jgi:hypothetical protein